MHTEVLLMVQGCPSVLCDENLDENETFKIDSSLAEICHPGELQLLDQLLQFGAWNRKIQKFLNRFAPEKLFRNAGKEAKDLNSDEIGLYLCAFAQGIQGFVKKFRICIAEIEDEASEDTTLGLQHLLYRIQPYRSQLESLCSLVDEIYRSQPHGSQLLSLIFTRHAQAPGNVAQVFSSCLNCCHRVLSQQLTSWLSLGQVKDKYSEFFVENNTYENTEIGPWNRFTLRTDLLPPYITLELADWLLFSGHCVNVFKELKDAQFDTHARVQRIGTELKEILVDSEPFDPLMLKRFLYKIRSQDAQHLWQLIAGPVGGRILDEIDNIKDLFFLGKGEFFLSFLDLTSHYMTQSPTKQIGAKFEQAREDAVRMLYLDESFAKRFRFSFGQSNDCLTALELQYEIRSPLDLILTPKVMQEAQLIFKFLFQVRSVQFSLDRLWLGPLKHTVLKSKPLVCQRVWQLRSRMSFLINSFQNYLHIDVLLSLYEKCVSDLLVCPDYFTAQRLVSTLLTTVTDYCGMGQKSIRDYLLNLLATCQKLCDLVQSQSFEGDFGRKFQELNLLFDRQTALFYKWIEQSCSNDRLSFLQQLLLRLDYNGYYGRNIAF